jgi:hypothetical protein
MQDPSDIFESLTMTRRPNETSTQFSTPLAELFRHADVGSGKVTTPPILYCSNTAQSGPWRQYDGRSHDCQGCRMLKSQALNTGEDHGRMTKCIAPTKTTRLISAKNAESLSQR